MKKLWASHPVLISTLVLLPGITLAGFSVLAPAPDITLIVSVLIVAITTIFIVSIYKLEVKNTALDEVGQIKALEISRLEILNQRIIKVASDGIIAADLNDQIVTCNPAAQTFLHLDTDKSALFNPHDLFHLGNPCHSKCPIFLAVHRSTEDSYLLELPINSKTVILEINVRPLDGPESGYVIVFRDITSQTLLSRTKEHIISVVSHEIRTPLTTIRGSLGLLKSGLFGALTAESKELMNRAIDNSERLMILVNDLLDLEKIDSLKSKLSYRSIFIDDFIDQAINQIALLTGRKNILIKNDTPHEAITADRNRLLQVITNLLHNAVKYSDYGTSIRISTSSLHDEHVFSIQDEGEGIPEDQLERIFDPFVQLSTVDNRSHDGSGLGLSICKAIVESHGGTISAHRAFPLGTVFRFTIPKLIENPISLTSENQTHHAE